MANPKTLDFVDSSWVQLPTDGAGKRVSHVLVDELQSDGSVQTVYFPAFVLADREGQTVDVVDGRLQVASPDLLEALTMLALEVRELREALSLAFA